MINQSLNGVEAVLLVGGPAGSGKTTIAEQIVTAPDEYDLPDLCPLPVHRTDWKSLHAKRFQDGTLIVEFATNKLSDPEHRRVYSDFIDALGKAAPIRAGYTANINRNILRKRYLQRMKPSHFLHVGKWKSWLRYLLATPSDDFGVAAWNSLLAEKSIRQLSWPISSRSPEAEEALNLTNQIPPD